LDRVVDIRTLQFLDQSIDDSLVRGGEGHLVMKVAVSRFRCGGVVGKR
jgi:hypothetical protein